MRRVSIAVGLGSLAIATSAQTSSSVDIALPGGRAPTYSQRPPAQLGDSTRVASITELRDTTAHVTANTLDCPNGQIWGLAYGIAACLELTQTCPAQFLTWSLGQSICQGFAPAGASVRTVVRYRQRGSAGAGQASCIGIPEAQCEEVYSIDVATPISVMSSPALSISTGYATATCVAGTWAITANGCNN